jgi:AAA15 family ATPase/GTPase
MLISFKFGNILSFDEPGELVLKAGKYSKHENHVIRSIGGYKLLRMAAIYGANAAGKSNTIFVIEQLRRIVVRGTVDRSETIPVIPFKFNDSKIPTRFDIEFVIQNNVYKYVLEINASIIINEILYKLDIKKDEFKEIFIRKSNKQNTTELTLNDVDNDQAKEKLRAEIYREDLRPNQPFLKEGANRSLKNILQAYTWFEKNLLIIGAFSRPRSICSFIESEKNTEAFNQIFNIFESGISKINVIKRPLEEYMGTIDEQVKNDLIRDINQYGCGNAFNGRTNIEIILENGKLYGQQLQTLHIGKNKKQAVFSLEEESDGIKRLLEIMPFLYWLDKNEVTVVIDELERSIHPILLINLLEYLNKRKTEKNGQLIFTTHESTLLDLDYFRQDEIWFVEKDNDGCSHVYSLADFKPRYDKDIRKSYFQGRFGAIPILGKPEFLEGI